MPQNWRPSFSSLFFAFIPPSPSFIVLIILPLELKKREGKDTITVLIHTTTWRQCFAVCGKAACGPRTICVTAFLLGAFILKLPIKKQVFSGERMLVLVSYYRLIFLFHYPSTLTQVLTEHRYTCTELHLKRHANLSTNPSWKVQTCTSNATRHIQS